MNNNNTKTLRDNPTLLLHSIIFQKTNQPHDDISFSLHHLLNLHHNIHHVMMKMEMGNLKHEENFEGFT